LKKKRLARFALWTAIEKKRFFMLPEYIFSTKTACLPKKKIGCIL